MKTRENCQVVSEKVLNTNKQIAEFSENYIALQIAANITQYVWQNKHLITVDGNNR